MVKPKAPTSLWEQMDAVRSSCISPVLEADWFKVTDYSARYQLNRRTALDQVNRLIAKGEVQRMGRVGSCVYYRLAKA